jgi:predicted Zn-dependent peptidase
MQFNPTMHKLSNGVTVLLDSMDLQTANVKVRFYTGARDEHPREHGITHFAEHMYCKGTKRFPTKKIATEYLDVNAGISNASTSVFDIQFHGRILAENLNVLIEFLGDRIQNSMFDPDKIEIERKVIMDELRRYLDDTVSRFNEFISKRLTNGQAGYGIRVLGTPETINSFTRDQMLEYMSRRLSAKNCVIGISGKIDDAQKTLECLEKTFSWLPANDVSENTEMNYTPAVAHNFQPNKKNVKIEIYFPNIHEMSYENIFKELSVSKFERFMKEKIYESVRNKNGLVYGFGRSDIGNEKFMLNGFYTETSVENLAKCVALIAKEAHKVYFDNGMTDKDLKRFCMQNRLGDANWLESPDQRCNKLIGFYHDYGRVYDFWNTVKMSQSIKADDVIKHSRGYFDGPLSIVTQGANFNADLKSIWQENFKCR